MAQLAMAIQQTKADGGDLWRLADSTAACGSLRTDLNFVPQSDMYHHSAVPKHAGYASKHMRDSDTPEQNHRLSGRTRMYIGGL